MKIELTEQQILQAIDSMAKPVKESLVKHLVSTMDADELDEFHNWYIRKFVFDPNKDEV